MTSVGSITQCLRDLEDEERRDDAVRELWDRFFEDVVRHALKRLRAMGVARSVADEEDVAERAFTKVYRGIKSGRLKLRSRVDFQKLLRATATREAIDQYHRARQDAGREADGEILKIVRDPEMTPELRALTDDACRRLLDLLGEDELRRLAHWKLVGHTNQEIARRLDWSLAKVERKLDRIREKWAGLVPDQSPMPGPRNAAGPDVADDVGGTTTILRGLAGRS